MDLKRCPRCEKELPQTAEFFKRSSRTKGGFFCYCKVCDSKRVAEWKEKNPDKVRANRREWAAKNPDAVKRHRESVAAQHGGRYAQERCARYASDPAYRARQQDSVASAFQRHGDKYKLRFWVYNQDPKIKKRNVRRALDWALLNPDRKNVQLQNRRARKQLAGGSFDESDVKHLLSAQRGMCCYCGCTMGGKHTVEHLVPLSRGGTNWPSNLALACGPCNARKGAKTVEEFLEFMAIRHNVNQPGVKNG